MPTNKYGRNDVIRKSPIGNHHQLATNKVITDSGKNHQRVLKISWKGLPWWCSG